MGIFDGIGNVSVETRHPSPPVGQHQAVLTKFMQTPRNPKGQSFLVAEMTINGATYSALKMIDSAYDGKYHKAFAKSVVAAALGVPHDDPDLAAPVTREMALAVADQIGVGQAGLERVAERPESVAHLVIALLMGASRLTVPITVIARDGTSKSGATYRDVAFAPTGAAPQVVPTEPVRACEEYAQATAEPASDVWGPPAAPKRAAWL
jgi:hypothetical protein